MLPLEKALFAGPNKDRDFNIVARHMVSMAAAARISSGRATNSGSRGNAYARSFPKPIRIRIFCLKAVPLSTARLPSSIQTFPRRLLSSKPAFIRPASPVSRSVWRDRQRRKIVVRTLPFRISSLGKTRYVVPALYPEFADIVGEVRQRVRKHGMVNIEEFLQSSPESNEAGRETGVLEAVLGSERDFRWLDKRAGWFWLSNTPRNCAVSRIRKMLAVANPLPLGEMRAGLARMGSPLAPERTLLEFCRQIKGITVRGNSISASPEIPATEVLNKTEWDLFQLLSENNGCMSNSDLICQSSVLGIKRPTFYQCVTYSPIVARFNGNHYRLIGASGPASGAVISTETAGNALRA